MSDHQILQPSNQDHQRSNWRNPFRTLALQFARGFRRWQRHRVIAALQRFDDRLLDDIGISRNDIPKVADDLFPLRKQNASIQQPANKNQEASDPHRMAA